MKVAIVNIGNSKGIRIPKSVLDQCHIEDEVDMKISDSEIIIKPLKKKPRSNWETSFKKEIAKHGADSLQIPDSDLSNIKGWEW